MEDPTAPTGVTIVLVPELERCEDDINSSHPLLPITRHCLKDSDKDRPSSAQLCQSMAELKAAPEYEESNRESQQKMTMLSLIRASLKAREEEVEELEQ